jgi:hypothetical protein
MKGVGIRFFEDSNFNPQVEPLLNQSSSAAINGCPEYFLFHQGYLPF